MHKDAQDQTPLEHTAFVLNSINGDRYVIPGAEFGRYGSMQVPVWKSTEKLVWAAKRPPVQVPEQRYFGSSRVGFCDNSVSSVCARDQFIDGSQCTRPRMRK